jgi:predicted dehydrogenase
MKKYRVGIIGCGRIGSLLEEDPLRGKPCTHAGAYHAHPRTRIVAGCDIDEKRLQVFGKKWKVRALYESYQEMLENEDLDIVSIATWTHLHSRMVIDAARWVRGIYCEKPMALTLKEADAMLRACRRNRVKLIINHERRWDPFYRKAKELIEKGEIGELRTIVGNALSSKPEKLEREVYGGGALFHDGTHLTDLLRFFAGEAEWVIGHEERKNGKRFIEETAFGMIHFKNGAHAAIEGGGIRGYFNFELDIQGSGGRILIGNGCRELYKSRPSKRFSGFTELERLDFPVPKRLDNPYISGVQDLIDAIEEKKKSFSSGDDGKRALEIILAIYRSAEKGGRKVSLPLVS